MPDLQARREALFGAIHDFVVTLSDVPHTFRAKYRKLADPAWARQRIRLLQYELGAAGCSVRGKVVLDAGCGTGLYSVMFALLGAALVEAMDFFPGNVLGLDQVAKKFELPIRARVGDVTHTELESGSVGLVYSTEAISHFHDWVAFLDESARIVGRGGHIIIADGNNGANPTVRRRILDFWQESEIGPFTVDGQYGPGKNLPYLYRRWMIIRKNFPQASDEDVYRLGLHTSQLGGTRLIEACRAYFVTGELPGPPYQRGQSQIRPEDEQRNEEPVRPLDIVAHLSNHGLKARARPHFGFGRSPLLPLVNETAARLGPLPLRFAQRYLILATRS